MTDSPPSTGDPLCDLIQERRLLLGHDGKPLSIREIARRSEGYVSVENARLLVAPSRHRGRLTDQTVVGLAIALQVPEERIYRVAGIPPRGEPWEWPDRFRRLNPPQRRLVEQLAAALLDAYDQGRNDRDKW